MGRNDMADEKLELLLNAALAATPQEREKSGILNVGFDTEEKTWEVIVKYHGDLSFLERLSILVEPLLFGYAILTVPESEVPLLSQITEIEYVEKPKRLYFQTFAGKQASCIFPVTQRPPYLSGEGVLVGIADSGIDYSHEEFLNEEGRTRIDFLWDQSLSPDAQKGWKAPEGFAGGVEFTAQQIDEALQAEGDAARSLLVPERDVSGHGTAVAGIAAGSSQGIAPKSRLLVVKLGMAESEGFPRTTELMRAVTYLVRKASALAKPLALNISFGNTYGSHDGTSLLERFLDNASEVGRCAVCVGSGNEAAARGHISGNVLEDVQIELAVGRYERTLNLQLWKNYADTFEVTLRSPDGGRLSFVTDSNEAQRLQRWRLMQTELLLYIGEPTPYSAQQEIYLDFLPTGAYIDGGIWTFTLTPIRTVTGNYSLYLPSQTAIGTDTGFYRPTPDTTLTIPSTASRVITVGAYDTTLDAYADFSGRGYVFAVNDRERLGITQSKPDIVAPGVGIVTAQPEGGYGSRTGTSFAAPFVTGAAALLMQWGIVMGNDRYLYGQKVKAYLQRGAQPLPGFSQYPNPLVGYGKLCLSESLPG